MGEVYRAKDTRRADALEELQIFAEALISFCSVNRALFYVSVKRPAKSQPVPAPGKSSPTPL